MTRRITKHRARSIDQEDLVVLTVYEPGINKERVKQINKFSKRHHVLVPGQDGFEWK